MTLTTTPPSSALRASFGAFGPSIVPQPEILDPPLGALTLWKSWLRLCALTICRRKLGSSLPKKLGARHPPHPPHRSPGSATESHWTRVNQSTCSLLFTAPSFASCCICYGISVRLSIALRYCVKTRERRSCGLHHRVAQCLQFPDAKNGWCDYPLQVKFECKEVDPCVNNQAVHISPKLRNRNR